MINKPDYVLLCSNLKIFVKELNYFKDLMNYTVSVIFEIIWVTVDQVYQYFKSQFYYNVALNAINSN
jgi:hypothetical protein